VATLLTGLSPPRAPDPSEPTDPTGTKERQ
jgi:hypothetical protein